MLYETDYWFWKSSIPSNLCDDIVQYGLSKQESKAWTGTAENPTPEETADKIRQSNVSWLDDRWIGKTDAQQPNSPRHFSYCQSRYARV